MKINLTKLYVDDQEKALKFYTDVVGFEQKADFSNEGYRWLTVGAPGEGDGVELQLELNEDPAARTYQEALFQQGTPAMTFQSDDVQADYDRMTGLGAEFTMPPTDVGPAIIATVNDGCGNLIQLTQVTWEG